jgi:hypothetical protein
MPASPVALGLQLLRGSSKGVAAGQLQLGQRESGPAAFRVAPAGSCSQVLEYRMRG